jgi:hypothetical protein
VAHPLARIHDADSALRWYLHLRDGGGQIKSLDILERRETCERCGKGPRTLKGVKGREREICASCGLSWKGEVVGWIKEFVSGSRDTDAPERLMDIWCRLRPMIEHRPRSLTNDEWLFDRTALELSIEGHGRSVTETTRVGIQRCSALASPARRWTPDYVRSAVERARKCIGRRLHDAKTRRGEA